MEDLRARRERRGRPCRRSFASHCSTLPVVTTSARVGGVRRSARSGAASWEGEFCPGGRPRHDIWPHDMLREMLRKPVSEMEPSGGRASRAERSVTASAAHHRFISGASPVHLKRCPAPRRNASSGAALEASPVEVAIAGGRPARLHQRRGVDDAPGAWDGDRGSAAPSVVRWASGDARHLGSGRIGVGFRTRLAREWGRSS